MSTSYFFLGKVFSGDGHTRITSDKDTGFAVHGGTQEDHKMMVELTRDVADTAKRECPESRCDMDDIVQQSMRRVGMKSVDSRRGS
jgi:hypothetical protein